MSTQFNKRLYTASEFYRFLHDFMRTIKYTRKAEKDGTLSKDFVERIMLSVTEVNGCELCSYKHTEDALKEGISQEEINAMLSGESENIPEEQSVAIFFGQHYADQKGKPSKDSWLRLVDAYGEEKALAILGAIRGIMMGNTHGIALGALKNRLKGEKVEKSSLGYELGIIFSIIPFVPAAFIHSLISNISNKSIISFD